MLATLDIETPEHLAQHDPFAVCARLKATHPGVSPSLPYAWIVAVDHRRWREVARDVRTSFLLHLQGMGLLPIGPCTNGDRPSRQRAPRGVQLRRRATR